MTQGKAKKVCGARKRDGGVCGMPAGKKTTHLGFGACWLHGGLMPNHSIAAEKAKTEQAEARTLDFLKSQGVVDPISSPLDAIADIAAEAQAFLRYCGEQLANLQQNSWRYNHDKGAEQLRGEVALYERALDRCERFLVSWARLNIDERLAAITERQADAVIMILAGVLADLDLPLEVRARADDLVPLHLRKAGASLLRAPLRSVLDVPSHNNVVGETPSTTPSTPSSP